MDIGQKHGKNTGENLIKAGLKTQEDIGLKQGRYTTDDLIKSGLIHIINTHIRPKIGYGIC